MFYRIVGNNIEIQGKFQAGTTTVTEGRIGLPTGYTSADSTRIATIQAVGHWWEANPTVVPGAILIEPSVTYVTLGSGSAGNNSFGKLNASAVAASNELVGFFASIPLSGTGVGTTVQIPSGPALVTVPKFLFVRSVKVHEASADGSANDALELVHEQSVE